MFVIDLVPAEPTIGKHVSSTQIAGDLARHRRPVCAVETSSERSGDVNVEYSPLACH